MKPWLKKVVDGDTQNHLLPFLWMLGEEFPPIERQIERIYESGIRAVCLESRTFEDFCGDSWWDILEKILQKARTLGMKVWVLDDKHFPTGYAVGLVDAKYPERRRLHLGEQHLDVIGPRPVELLVEPYVEGDTLLGVCAVRRAGRDEMDLTDERIVLQPDENGKFVRFDVPEGCWRVFFLWATHAGSNSREGRINPLDPESVDVLIEAVYESHYAHVGEYFGKELVGFFSDEPCFGNTWLHHYMPNGGFYNKTVGQPMLALPWRADLLELLNQRFGRDMLSELPLLWYNGTGFEALREAYMDIVSAAYGEHFTKRLGDWCRAHGVEYIGHIIEDMNSHARLGSSAGHYFRSLEGQDMSGIDIVLHQILPGFAQYDSAAITAGHVAESKFFHHVLGKLAGSLAHIRPHMKGRAMCEVFGAYGWAEDMPTMKWLMDYLMVRGVNQFVPHAFTALYPNPDCPPHFDADGENPQYPDFAALMHYTNQLCDLLEGNRRVRVAMLYHAEAEWSGRPCMLNDDPAVELLEHQIDFDIVPADDLLEPVLANGQWQVGYGCYDVMVIPAAEYLPDFIKQGVQKLRAAGVTVLQADALTEGLDAEVVPLSSLSAEITRRGFADLRLETPFPMLRTMQVERADADVFMLFNEDTIHTADTMLQLPVSGSYLAVDLLGGKLTRHHTADGRVPLKLVPFESVVLVFDGEEEPDAAAPVVCDQPLEQPCRIELARCEAMDDYTLLCDNASFATPIPMDFAGRIRYTFTLSDVQDVRAIELTGVGDTALLRINGKEIGRRICAPYRFDTENAWQDGENTMEITVATTLGRKQRDGLSIYLAMNPSGLWGQILLGR